jgi:hypothetical protein
VTYLLRAKRFTARIHTTENIELYFLRRLGFDDVGDELGEPEPTAESRLKGFIGIAC